MKKKQITVSTNVGFFLASSTATDSKRLEHWAVSILGREEKVCEWELDKRSRKGHTALPFYEYVYGKAQFQCKMFAFSMFHSLYWDYSSEKLINIFSYYLCPL